MQREKEFRREMEKLESNFATKLAPSVATHREAAKKVTPVRARQAAPPGMQKLCFWFKYLTRVLKRKM